MIFLYSMLLIFLGVAKFLIGRRVAVMEKRYTKAALAADSCLRSSLLKKGNSNLPDPYDAAKRQFLLGSLVQQRDRLEVKHDAWQRFFEMFSRIQAAVRNWKGRKLPYTFGVVDVSCLLAAMDFLGVGDYVSPRQLVQLVATYFTNG